MLFKKSPEKFWDLISSMYAASPVSDSVSYQSKIQTIKSYLSPGDVVLDIGCGTGTQCDDLAESVKQVIGVDISSKLLAIAEQRKAERNIENVEFIQTSLFDDQFNPESFNLVMTFYILHFFEDIDEFFTRVYELLKPDGLYIYELPCLGEKNLFMARLLRFAGYLGFVPLINMLTYK